MPEKTSLKKRKKANIEKTRQEIWVGTMTQALNSPSHKATLCKQPHPRLLK